MNVLDFIQNNGQKTIANPNYNFKSKKNIQPSSITIPDIEADNDAAVNMAIVDFNNQYSIDSKENEKYRKYGLNYNLRENLDKDLANAQSNTAKIFNSIAQTVVSEIGLGTARGIFDLVDMIGQVTGISDGDYSNPVSQYLEQKQEEFREWAPIYADPDKHITNGGLLDPGWWASNMPSVASSLTLLIPSTGVVKGLSWAGKTMKLGSFTRKSTRVISGAEKAIKEGQELNKVQRFVNASSTAKSTGLFLENGTTAALSRAIENYQEARQTYSDMYANASESLKQMNDDEYKAFLNRNKEIIDSSDANPEDRDSVAKAVAKASADRTFQMDWANVAFDVVQMYALRNAWKGLKNAPEGSAKVRRANLDAAKYFGKTEAEIAEAKAARKFSEKAKEYVGDKLLGAKLVVGAELSEGVEEAVNYIAQQEGMHLGNVMLGKEEGSNDTGWLASAGSFFDKRMSQYITAPELWDSAFWGVMGGVVFQGLGSSFRRVANKLTDKKSDATDEAKQQLPWYELDELPEIQRRKSEIEARGIDFQQYQQHLAKIKKGIDIYKSSEGNEVKFDSEQERQAAETKLKNEYIAKMTLRAMNSGNLNMLKAYLADDNVRKGMVAAGMFNEEGKTKSDTEVEQESKQYIDDALNQVEKVERMYDEELVAIDSASSVLNSRRHKKNDDFLGNSDIPAEYIQIVAVNNVKARLQMENLDTELTAVNSRIGELETQFADQLDPNINHEHNVALAVLTHKLGQLRAQKKAIAAEEGKSLSNQIALSNIDKQIQSIEDKLSDPAELVYANFISLQYTLDEHGKANRSSKPEDVAEAYAYRDKMIVQGLGQGENNTITIPGLEHLSDRSRNSLSDAEIGRYQTLESDAAETYTTLRNISPELDMLYQVKALSEQEKDNVKLDIARTVDDVQEQVGMLHNTMNEARNKAINAANDTIQNLYKKNPTAVRYALFDLNNALEEHNFKEDTKDLTEEERTSLRDAIKVLALTKSYNQSLVKHIEHQFDIQDTITFQQEVQNDADIKDNDSQNSATLNQSNTATQNSSLNNLSQSTSEATTGQENRQNQSVAPISNPQETESRTPNYYTKFYTDNKGTQSGRKSPTDHGGVAVYDNQDGTFTLDVRNNASYLNNPVFFETAGEVDLTRPYTVETKPIAVENKKGKLVVSQPGRLVNTDTEEYTQQQAAAQQQVTQEAQQQQEEQPATTPQESIGSPASTELGNTPATPTATQANPATTSSTGEQAASTETLANTAIGSTKSTSTLSSTSTPVEEAVVPVVEPVGTPANNPLPSKSDEEVINQVPSDDAIKNESLSKVMAEARANHDVDLTALATQLTNDYVAKGVDRTVAEKAVNWATSVIQRRLNRTKNNDTTVTMRSSIDEVLANQSSLVELGNNTNPFVDAYKQAVKQMIGQYANETGIRTINGKTYINLEDLLRYTNESTNDASTASIMYNALKEYLKSDEAKQSFITTDESEVDKNEFLDNVKKTAEERYIERLADTSVQRVDIRSFINKQLEQNNQKLVDDFFEALDDLQPGQQLTTKFNGDAVEIRDSKDRLVGTLGVPQVNKSTGAYITFNDGWKTDVLASNNGAISSRLKDLFQRWLTSNDNNCKELNDIIFELAYTKPNAERKLELLDAFKSNPEIINAKAKEYVSPKASDKQLINGLVKLWRFTKTTNATANKVNNIRIKGSLNAWFQKLNHSYDAVMALAKGADINCSVATISDGELIRAQNVVEDPRTLPVASEAIAGGVNPTIHKIAIADKNNPGTLDVSGSNPVQFAGVGTANTFVMIPNRSGRPGYVHAYPCETSDAAIGQDAKDIISAIEDEATELFKAYANNRTEDNYEALKNFLATALSLERGNSSLFRGITVTIKQLNGNEAVSIAIPGTANVLQFYKNGRNGRPAILVRINDGTGFKNYSFNDSKTISTIKQMINNLHFNLSYAYIASDNVSDMHMKGFATKRNGKFEIKIKDKTWTYDSFNEFVLKNNLVRLNTKPSANGKSNYNRRGERSQAANQVFEIKLNKATASNASSPVEDSNTSSAPATPALALSISQKAQVILDSTDAKQNKGLDIAKLVFSKDVLKAFETLQILPKNIIFDAEFNNRQGYENINAEVNKRTGVVTVGTKWKALFDNPTTRNQAIRKLIHEELHNKLTKNRGYLRSAKEIYNDFKEAFEAGIDNEWYSKWCEEHGVSKEDANTYFKQYLFGDENEDVALEEFLVESLTSSDLAEMLNSIDAKDYDAKHGAKNLLQKVLELMSKVFGWNVREGSLYEKELKTLRENFKDEATKDTEVQQETTIQQDPTAQQEDNLGENQNDITSEQIVTNTPQAPINVPSTEHATPSKFGENRSRRLRGKFKSAITEVNIDSKYSLEIQTIKDAATADGTFMKAPNGKPSNLTERQWLHVRTKAFKTWFGDWENNPSEASKVVDENGEPLVVYHNSNSKFTNFELGHNFNYYQKSEEFVFHFGNKTTANNRTTTYNMAVFLSARNVIKGYDGMQNSPIEFINELLKQNIISKNSFSAARDAINNIKYDYSISHKQRLEKMAKYINNLLEINGKPNSVILYSNNIEGVGEDSYMILNPNQIKSATANVGTYANDNNSTYRSSVTEVTTNIPSVTSFTERLPLEQQPKFGSLIASASISTSCR